MAVLKKSSVDPFVRVKTMFFDRPGVMAKVDAATKRALSKAGAYIRSDAKKSMRPAGKKKGYSKPSPPGTPPRSRKGHVKRFLFFSWDPAKRTVVVGPELLPRGRNDNLKMLEHGGRRSMLSPGPAGLVPINANYPPRPFMRPALAKNIHLLPQLYKDSVR